MPPQREATTVPRRRRSPKPGQTPSRPPRYLFVCHANLHRSPTAVDVCRSLAEARGVAVEAESAGMSSAARRPITRAMADAADLIFVMEDSMKQALCSDYGQPASKVVCLDIPDIYQRGDLLLVRQLHELLAPYVR